MGHGRGADGTDLLVSPVGHARTTGKNWTLNMAIPNVFHFAFGFQSDFGGKPFGLVHYLAIKSACEVNSPAAAYFYCKHKPEGFWFEQATPYITYVPIEPPVEVFGPYSSSLRPSGRRISPRGAACPRWRLHGSGHNLSQAVHSSTGARLCPWGARYCRRSIRAVQWRDPRGTGESLYYAMV